MVSDKDFDASAFGKNFVDEHYGDVSSNSSSDKLRDMPGFIYYQSVMDLRSLYRECTIEARLPYAAQQYFSPDTAYHEAVDFKEELRYQDGDASVSFDAERASRVREHMNSSHKLNALTHVDENKPVEMPDKNKLLHSMQNTSVKQIDFMKRHSTNMEQIAFMKRHSDRMMFRSMGDIASLVGNMLQQDHSSRQRRSLPSVDLHFGAGENVSKDAGDDFDF